MTSDTKINPKWIRKLRRYFKRYLDDTGFPHPVRNGERGPGFKYPEWLIMFIAALAVKMKIKNYLALHRFVKEYWDVIGADIEEKAIPESTMRDRLKKIRFEFGETPGFLSSMFPEDFFA